MLISSVLTGGGADISFSKNVMVAGDTPAEAS